MDNVCGNSAFTGASTSNASSQLTMRPDDLVQVNDSVWEFYRPSHRDEVPKVEVIFFHGAQLSTDTQAFWNTWLSRDKTVIWPAAWLGQKFPEGRMLFISYDSSIRNSFDSSGQKDVNQTMENLIHDVIRSPTCKAGQKCPVIFVGHCFGGIIIKQFLIRCCELTGLEHADDPGMKEVKLFLQNCKAIFYYSTPNGGSDLMYVLAYTDIFFGKVNQPLVDFLKVLGPKTARINSTFSKLRHRPNRKWETRGIGETVDTQLKGSTRRRVVSQASARQDVDKIYWVGDDHFNVAKAKNNFSCDIFLMLCDLIYHYCSMSSSSTIQLPSFTTVPAPLGQGLVSGENKTPVEELLLNLVSKKDDEQRSAAGELRMLARSSDVNRLRIADAGAIPLLIKLLRAQDVKTQEHAVTTLLNLSIAPRIKGTIVGAGAINPIVSVLTSGSSSMEARENTAATLFSLSVVDANKIAIGEAPGAIPALVELLRDGTASGKKHAACALANLSIYRHNKARAVGAGVVPTLMSLLNDSTSGVVEEALAILAILSTHHDGRAAIGQASAVPTLVARITSGSRSMKENAAAVLLTLCASNSASVALANELGADKLLSELSQTGTPRAKRKSIQLLELLQIKKKQTLLETLEKMRAVIDAMDIAANDESL